MKRTVIGIDLGTTTTEAAVFRNQKAEMIPNFDGSIVTPSAVGLDEAGNVLVGEKARARYILEPERTAIEIKRKIGSGEKIKLGRESFSAAELSSFLLSYVKRYAAQHLEEEVAGAVISVPAYFDDLQRQEVVEAAKKAGVTVERLINEPTAAAMSYGVRHMEEESQILVYDLGGGTFDVTLLEMFDGVLEVKASSGDNQLGGKDFDERLVDWLRTRFEEKNGIRISKDVYAMARLKDAAEKCKIELSTQEEAVVQIPMLAKKNHVPLALEERVSREQFEGMIEDLIERTHQPINVVLADSGVRREELAMVLLVGGSTRIPLVSRDLEKFLGIRPVSEVHPDYCVAQGAAVCAAMITGALDGENGLVMTDVNPYTLGVRTSDYYNDDIMSVIIPRNVTIPVTRSEAFYTMYPGQDTVEVQVYQGESKTASENHFLGNFLLKGIPVNRRDPEKVYIAFTYNINGMLQVEATVARTGKKADLAINLLGEKEEERMDVSAWRGADCAALYRSLIRRAESRLRTGKPEMEDGKYRNMEDLLYRLKKAILDENETLADRIADELEDALQK